MNNRQSGKAAGQKKKRNKNENVMKERNSGKKKG